MDFAIGFEYWIAGVFTVLFGIMFLLSIVFGIGDELLSFFDVGGGGGGFFSSISAMSLFGGIAGWGWAYIFFDENGASYPFIYSMILGVGLLFLLGGLQRVLARMGDSDGAETFKVSKGDYGIATTTILPNREMGSKGTFTLKGIRADVNVVSDSNVAIPSGASIVVDRVSGSEAHPIVVVKPA